MQRTNLITKKLIRKRFFNASISESFINEIRQAPLFLRDLLNVYDQVGSFNALLKSTLDIVAPEKIKKGRC